MRFIRAPLIVVIAIIGMFAMVTTVFADARSAPSAVNIVPSMNDQTFSQTLLTSSEQALQNEQLLSSGILAISQDGCMAMAIDRDVGIGYCQSEYSEDNNTVQCQGALATFTNSTINDDSPPGCTTTMVLRL